MAFRLVAPFWRGTGRQPSPSARIALREHPATAGSKPSGIVHVFTTVTDPTRRARDALVERGAIRSWARVHGATPVRSKAEAGVPLGFSFLSDPSEAISWRRFFTAFEQSRLALLVAGDDFAFVDRTRLSGDPDTVDEGRPEDW